jgi:hypothetical protein
MMDDTSVVEAESWTFLGHFIVAEREEILQGVIRGESMNEIALQLVR